MSEATIELSDERVCKIEKGEHFTYISVNYGIGSISNVIMLDNEDAVSIAEGILMMAEVVKNG